MSCLKLSCQLIHGCERKSSQRDQYDWWKVKKWQKWPLWSLSEKRFFKRCVHVQKTEHQPVQSSLSINLQTLGLGHGCEKKDKSLVRLLPHGLLSKFSSIISYISHWAPAFFLYQKRVGQSRCPCLFGWPTFMDVSLDFSRIPLTYIKTYKQFSCKYLKFIMMPPLCWDKTWSILDTFRKIEPINRSLTYRAFFAYTFLEFYINFFSKLPNLTIIGNRIDRHCLIQLHPSFHTFQLFALNLDNFSGQQCNGGGSWLEHFTVDSLCLPGLSQKGVTLPILETKADNLTNLMNKGLR